jgi:hypothetical protein
MRTNVLHKEMRPFDSILTHIVDYNSQEMLIV